MYQELRTSWKDGGATAIRSCCAINALEHLGAWESEREREREGERERERERERETETERD